MKFWRARAALSVAGIEFAEFFPELLLLVLGPGRDESDPGSGQGRYRGNERALERVR
jgi:hypothetical protein